MEAKAEKSNDKVKVEVDLKKDTKDVKKGLEVQLPSGDTPFYRSNMQARNIIIQRSGLGSLGGRSSGSSGSYAERSMVVHPSFSMPSGSYASISSQGVLDVTKTRKDEKIQLQDLNERLANFIEKVRFLEAQNRRLADELEKLKSKWGRETIAIKAMYMAELDEARRLLDDAVKEKSKMEIRVASIEEVLEEMRIRLEDAHKEGLIHKDRLEKQDHQIADYDGELSLLRKRCLALENERDKERANAKKLQDMLNSARADLDNETLQHIDAENRRQTLEEELEFLKALHEQELKELQALAYRDTTTENREFWKSEMGPALREIQTSYDEKLEGMRADLEGQYHLKIQEFRTGATKTSMESMHSKEEGKRMKLMAIELKDRLSSQDIKLGQVLRELEEARRAHADRERELEGENLELKGELTKLRAEMEAILKELQLIIDTKLGLELEIAAYRRLLEGEESRIGLRQIVDNLSGDSSPKVTQVVKGEMSAKTTYQKSAKGPVAINESASDGKFIVLENTGKKDEDLSGWIVTRDIDGKEKTFKLPAKYVIKANDKSKIYAKGHQPSPLPATDLVYDENTWGVGSNVATKLSSPDGEVRATHVAKTNYA